MFYQCIKFPRKILFPDQYLARHEIQYGCHCHVEVTLMEVLVTRYAWRWPFTLYHIWRKSHSFRPTYSIALRLFFKMVIVRFIVWNSRPRNRLDGPKLLLKQGRIKRIVEHGCCSQYLAPLTDRHSTVARTFNVFTTKYTFGGFLNKPTTATI